MSDTFMFLSPGASCASWIVTKLMTTSEGRTSSARRQVKCRQSRSAEDQEIGQGMSRSLVWRKDSGTCSFVCWQGSVRRRGLS